MLVCPECRRDNPEQAQFCTGCGRSLEPSSAPMRSSQRGVLDEPIDIPAPKPPNPIPGLVTLIVLVLAVGAIGSWLALRPSVCEGKFASDRYPYCVTLPRGWSDSDEELSGGATADAFQPQAQGVIVLVLSEQVQPGTNTSAYADAQRDGQQAGGLFPSEPEQVEVAGTNALAWEITATSEAGMPLHQLMVAVVREARGWIILFAGNEDIFDDTRPVFDSMLDSWSWR